LFSTTKPRKDEPQKPQELAVLVEDNRLQDDEDEFELQDEANLTPDDPVPNGEAKTKQNV